MRYDVVGIGNAIVDVISQADDETLDGLGVDKGIMQLVDQDRAEALYDAMEVRYQAPGGSVANTLAGLGALGLRTAFIGRVADDRLGRFYAKSLADAGTGFPNPPRGDGTLSTSRSMIFVTPDGERSMNTYLGISAELGPEDVAEDVAGGASLLFLEGYLFDRPAGREAFEAASRACRAAGGMAAITLADPVLVERHRREFRRLVRELDVVIGNEKEWGSLYQSDDAEAALRSAVRDTPLAVCTRSGGAVTAIREGERVDVEVERIMPTDATGAGDQFAAGFLFGLSRGRALEDCVRMGNVAATEVIGHFGPRPKADVAALFRREGLSV